MKNRILFMLSVLSVLAVSGTELPDKFQVKCGEITVGVSKRSFWNLNGIWFKGTECCFANTAWYGTTTSYGKGWVGSGHLENGIGEKEVGVKFFLNGAVWHPVSGQTAAESFEYEKTSLVGEMQLKYSVKVSPEKIVELVEMRMRRPMGMTVYHYMHPWNRIFTEYLFIDRNGEKQSGVFASDKRDMKFLKHPFRFAGYSPRMKTGFIQELESISPITQEETFLLWNRLSDRKLYFVPVREKKVPANVDFKWSMTTVFFNAEPEQWQKNAAETVIN